MYTVSTFLANDTTSKTHGYINLTFQASFAFEKIQTYCSTQLASTVAQTQIEKQNFANVVTLSSKKTLEDSTFTPN